jgi:hypothetical protein
LERSGNCESDFCHFPEDKKEQNGRPPLRKCHIKLKAWNCVDNQISDLLKSVSNYTVVNFRPMYEFMNASCQFVKVSFRNLSMDHCHQIRRNFRYKIPFKTFFKVFNVI